MKNIRTKTALLLLLTAFASPAFAQEEAKQEKSPLTDVEAMTGEVLAGIYAEVKYIPENQWFELWPAVESYVRELFEARKMSDGIAATLRVAEAKAKMDAFVDSVLDENQKQNRTNRRAETDTWLEEMNTHFVAAKDSLMQKARINGSATLKFEDDGVSRSVY